MATHQLGPETPRPFAVISERGTRTVNIPQIPQDELYSFGPAYQQKMYELVHRYLELGTDDRLCYVGQDKGSLAPFLQEKFCLLEPITVVNPGHIHYEESSNCSRVPIKIAHVGADEFFREQLNKDPQFDKVLVNDSLHYFTSPKETYTNIMRCIRNMGRLLIIHRPAPMNTLPLSNQARERMQNSDEYYMNIIHDLQVITFNNQLTHCLLDKLPVVRTRHFLMDLNEVKWHKRTNSQNINNSRLVLQVSLPTPLKPGVKSRMEM